MKKFFEKITYSKKMDRVARRGPLARALGTLKGGHFRNCRKSHNAEKLKGETLWDFKHPICCKISKRLKGDPLERKKIGKKVSQCRKLKGGTLLGFSTSILPQNIKKLKGGLFSEKKSRSAEKNSKVDPLGFSNIHSDAKQQKIEGGTLGKKVFSKKSLAVPKMKGGTLWSRPVWYVTRKNRKNLFGSVR